MQTALILAFSLTLAAPPVWSAVPEGHATGPNGMMDHYGKMQQALAGDKIDDAKAHARELVAVADAWLKSSDSKVRYYERVKKLRDATEQFAATGDRNAFRSVSDEAVRYVNQQLPLQNAWSRYVCRTKTDKVEWLEPASETKATNPYGGDKTCAVLSPWLRHRQ